MSRQSYSRRGNAFMARKSLRRSAHKAPAPIVLVMGVSGSGKTTFGAALASRLGWAFLDADRFHGAANIAKMAAGVPLDDADRAPWLAAIARTIRSAKSARRPAVLACSALKRRYRDELRAADPELKLIFLRGDAKLIARRLARRRGHFMPPVLLNSQIAALEPPAPDEGALALDGANSTLWLLAAALGWLALSGDR